jgi:hypothetical protein
MKPRGGTELQFEFLEKHVSKDLLRSGTNMYICSR